MENEQEQNQEAVKPVIQITVDDDGLIDVSTNVPLPITEMIVLMHTATTMVTNQLIALQNQERAKTPPRIQLAGIAGPLPKNLRG